jgi:hypothetical protein
MNEISLLNDQKSLDVAVLFIVFNRIETTKQVFEAIRKAKPSKLYVAADGGRDNRADEIVKVKTVRDYVLNNIDWACEVNTLFQDKNLGCKYAVSTAITWFFKNEDQGIILEDDCLPSQSFFLFCNLMLNRYVDHKNIYSISGSCFVDDNSISTFFFSKYPLMWGWASWSDRWDKYKVNYHYNNFTLKYNVIGSFKHYIYWNYLFKKTSENKIDTWDYQWIYLVFKNKGMVIRPPLNLVQNIGFDSYATHTIDSNNPISLFRANEIDLSKFKFREPSLDNNDHFDEKYWLNVSLKTLLAFYFPFLVNLSRLLRRICS